MLHRQCAEFDGCNLEEICQERVCTALTARCSVSGNLAAKSSTHLGITSGLNLRSRKDVLVVGNDNTN